MPISPNYTLTFDMKLLTGAADAGTLTLELDGFPDDQFPTVAGTSIVASTLVVVQAAGDGTGSITLYGIDQFTDYTGTDTDPYYSISAKSALGSKSNVGRYRLVGGGTHDLSNLTPLEDAQVLQSNGFTPIVGEATGTQTINNHPLVLAAGGQSTTVQPFDGSTNIATTEYVDTEVLYLPEINEDFINANTSTSITTATAYAADAGWSVAQISGGTQSIQAQSGTFQNPGQAVITTSAAVNQGLTLYKGGGALASGPLGPLGGNAGWQIDFWLILHTTITNYCVRAGLTKGGQQATDFGTSGWWLEYDTNNSNSNSVWTIHSENAGSTYIPTLVTPTASGIYHFRIRSVVAGTILFSVGANNVAPGAEIPLTGVDTTNPMGPFVHVITRTAASTKLILDAIKYRANPGRV